MLKRNPIIVNGKLVYTNPLYMNNDSIIET